MTNHNKPKFDEHSIIKRFHSDINKHFGTDILWDENDLKGSYERFMTNFVIRTRDETMKIYNSPDHLLDSKLKSIGVSFYKCMYDHTEPHAYVIYEPDNIFTNPDTKKSEDNEYVMVLIKKDFAKKAVADNYYVNESLIHLDKMESRDIIESIEWMLQNSSAELSEHTNIIATNISLFNSSNKKVDYRSL